MMTLIQNSSNLAGARHLRRRVVPVFLLALCCFSCSDPEAMPSNPAPRADAAADTPASKNDASNADANAIEDATSETFVDATGDRSVDATASDRSLDGPTADRSLDAPSSDVSLDAGADSEVSSDDAGADASDGSVGDGAVTDQDRGDSDAPPLSATCTADQACTGGNCQGTSCDQAWFCWEHFAPHPCPPDIGPFCGCDGKTYYFPLLCPEIPYEHAGECGDGVNCDPYDVRCKQAEPDCGPGKVASVVAGCYGPCVPITSCRCIFPVECPQRDKYSCKTDRQRCDFEIEP